MATITTGQMYDVLRGMIAGTRCCRVSLKGKYSVFLKVSSLRCTNISEVVFRKVSSLGCTNLLEVLIYQLRFVILFKLK